MTARDEFLRRVRQAVAEGNRAGGAAPLEPRGAVGYQGAGPDVVARFRDELAAAGGQTCVVPDRLAACAAVLALVHRFGARRVLLGRGHCVDTLGLEKALQDLGVEVLAAEGGGSVHGGVIRTRSGNRLAPAEQRGAFFAADVGVSGVDYLVAETGSLALLSGPGQPRSLSLLPPVHIAVAERAQLLPDLFDLFEARLWAERQGLPSCLSLITGPSKTGDIELRLVTGVHGPGEVHVVLIDASLPRGVAPG
jgi:L-lactate utilization protein LutC